MGGERTRSISLSMIGGGGCTGRIHMLADLKSRHNLTAYLVRRKKPTLKNSNSQDSDVERTALYLGH